MKKLSYLLEHLQLTTKRHRRLYFWVKNQERIQTYF